MRPIPCSALMEPPRSSTISCTAAFSASQFDRIDVLVHADRLADIVVDIAVAEMAEGDGPGAGDHQLHELVGPVDEFRHSASRDGHVMLDAAAFVLLHLAHHLAKLPEFARLLGGLRQNRVLDLAGVDGIAELRFCQRQDRIAGKRAGEFEEHIPGVRRSERVAQGGAVFDGEVETDPRQESRRR